MGLYDRYLSIRVRRQPGDAPAHVGLTITERDLLERDAYTTMEQFFEWVFDHNGDRVSVYVSVLDPGIVPTLRRSLEGMQVPAEMAVRGPSDADPATEPIQVGIGLGGKHEFANAVKGLAEAVDGGAIRPDEIDAADIESQLVFSDEPDLIIKTGAERLSDFMIWQSVYSELYFADVNWQNFRRRDYLRALLAYKRRTRRFGR